MTERPLIGAVADDVTGATDVAVAFRRNGLRTFLSFGTPSRDVAAEAIVVALPTRMIAPADAVAKSLVAANWLRGLGTRRIYFKYCSTFDSTERGNIGPVLDALASAAGAGVVVTTPASPEHGRTQYGGYLFVNNVLLSESHMRDHPVTPMRDSQLLRLLRAQTHETVGLLAYRDVAEGETVIGERVAEAERDGVRYLLADALGDGDLRRLGRAVVDLPLTAGAAGLAGGIAAALAERRTGVGGIATTPVERQPAAAAGQRPTAGPNGGTAASATEVEPPPTGRAVVLSGSCSKRTLEQVAHLHQQGRPTYFLDVTATPDAETLADAALHWYDSLTSQAAPLIYSTVEPERLQRIQAEIGVERAAALLEAATAHVAQGLAERGVQRFIAAGGETSGAVVAALGVDGGLIGAEAARGVPWIHDPATGLSLLLKSGNFGEPDLLARASANGGDDERPR